MFLEFIKNICIPSLIYLILGLVGTIASKNSIIGKIVNVIIVFLITYLLDYLCKTYGQTTSWYVLIILYFLIPFILLIIMMGILLFISDNKSINFGSLNFGKSLKKITPNKITHEISKIISSKI